jgi:HptB-dependent secretion and biofilm anti anti-sigma factor
VTITAYPHREGIRLALEGKLNFDARRVFREAVESRTEPHLYLDFRGVTYLDGCGLGLLAVLAKKAAGARQILTILGPQDLVADILGLANFGRLFTITSF